MAWRRKCPARFIVATSMRHDRPCPDTCAHRPCWNGHAPCCAGGELCPANTELLTQQGGCLVLQGQRVIYRHDDSGILKYVDCDAVLEAVSMVRV